MPIGCEVPRAARFTKREKQVAELIYQGLNNERIAVRLGVTKHTMKQYVNRILRKAGAKSKYEMVARKLSAERTWRTYET